MVIFRVTLIIRYLSVLLLVLTACTSPLGSDPATPTPSGPPAKPFVTDEGRGSLRGPIRGEYQIFPDKIIITLKDTIVHSVSEEGPLHIEMVMLTIGSPANEAGVGLQERWFDITIEPGEQAAIPTVRFTFSRDKLPDDELRQAIISMSFVHNEKFLNSFATKEGATFEF